jgi:hypothetical protein
MARNPMSNAKQGCVMLFAIPLVVLTAVVMFLFVFLPLRLFIGVAGLLGFKKRLSRPHPRNRRD